MIESGMFYTETADYFRKSVVVIHEHTFDTFVSHMLKGLITEWRVEYNM